jgi:mitochondrial pyruvate carrier 1
VQPRNYLLFACHFTNAAAQTVQDARFINYWYFGGREKKLGITPASEHGAGEATGKVMEAVVAARNEAKKSSGK